MVSTLERGISHSRSRKCQLIRIKLIHSPNTTKNVFTDGFGLNTFFIRRMYQLDTNQLTFSDPAVTNALSNFRG